MFNEFGYLFNYTYYTKHYSIWLYLNYFCLSDPIFKPPLHTCIPRYCALYNQHVYYQYLKRVSDGPVELHGDGRDDENGSMGGRVLHKRHQTTWNTQTHLVSRSVTCIYMHQHFTIKKRTSRSNYSVKYTRLY